MVTRALQLLVLYTWACTAACAEDGSQSADHGVILVYHHVSEKTPPSTSVSPSRFAQHLDYIEQHGYVVWPLTKLVEQLRNAEAIPDNVVALTFDDAYQSIASDAHPMLQRRGWPYTVFVNTASVDAGHNPYLSWDQLRELVRDGVTIGNHSHNHAHLLARVPGTSVEQHGIRVNADIQHAQQRIHAELGMTPTSFAYPYGEYDATVSKLVTDAGLTGFGQHSGAVGFNSDFSALPRFPMGGAYAGLDLLATRLQTQPLYVQADPPGPLVLTGSDTRPLVELELVPGAYDAARLACYASGQGAMTLVREADPQRVRIAPQIPLAVGRSKFNCTVPHQARAGVFFWWSYLVMTPGEDGLWYDG
jgi:peptidoglycan/xylan/chitin deacetylase (PgdA/CDA1 family)